MTPGCDVAGTVIKTGPNAISPLGKAFKEGDAVFACSRLGVKGYAPWAEKVHLYKIHADICEFLTL
jgi:NADPH:quinone reductase-like Zn-dependent oxidoreductase